MRRRRMGAADRPQRAAMGRGRAWDGRNSVNDTKENQQQDLRVPLARPWFDGSEADAAREVVASRWLISGPKVAEFERRFAAVHGCEYGIAVNSGSSALLVAMAALGVGAGDEVIVPNMTFVSTATACMFLGAEPVFCDIEPIHHNLDPARLAALITPRTKVICPVHYAGHVADMDAINDIAEAHDLKVLEDAAEAHLSNLDGRYVGSLGHAGIFSFTPSKPMTTGEGGMILTSDEQVAESCRLWRNFGDTDKFCWDHLGFNFRMPEVMGAMGLHQLDKLEDAIAARRRIGATYTRFLSEEAAIRPPTPLNEQAINYQLYTLRLDLDRLSISRDEVIRQLSDRGVSTRLYYPPLHRARVFERFGGYRDEDFPETVAYSACALSLPIYPELTEAQQELVSGALLEIISNHRR
jgi:perosamine synthetase